MVTENLEYAVGLLTDLKRLGVQLAIDDFGQAYPRSATQDVPARQPQDRQVVRSGIGDERRGHLYRATVETCSQPGHGGYCGGSRSPEQRILLEQMGCDLAQG